MKALTFSVFGGPEVLSYITVPDPIPAPNQILVSTRAIGLNFADIYRRKGNYHLTGKPPYIAGYEGAGVVVDNNGHPGFKVGDSIAFVDVPLANAELIAVPTTHAIPLPPDIDFELAASVLLQGLTAHYLAIDSHAVEANEVVVIHAASGGVGQILTQMCKLKGATVIGLTSSVTKKEGIIANGADAVFLLSEDWKAGVLKMTENKGADVVYDSIGSTLTDSLEIVKEKGQVVFYGMSGGDPLPVDPRYLMDGSKTLTGGDLWSYLSSQEERLRRAAELFDLIRTKRIHVKPAVTYPLSDGRSAHEFLEGGKSAGKVLLIP